MKIGMLYICTGKYVVMWPEFYKSMRENFCPSSERHWFVFTDAAPETIEGYGEDANIHIIYQEAQPWPYATLFKFETYDTAQEQLQKMDYLFNWNANAFCAHRIDENEVLPRSDDELIAVPHLGFLGKKPWMTTLERNPGSRAYIPYNKGEIYIQPGVMGGASKEFLAVSKELAGRIRADLNEGIIACFHDESHWNRYLCEGHPYRLLSNVYNYPENFPKPDFEPKIIMRDKGRYFDVEGFKGVDTGARKYYRWLRPIYVPIVNTLKDARSYCCYLRDTLLKKDI